MKNGITSGFAVFSTERINILVSELGWAGNFQIQAELHENLVFLLVAEHLVQPHLAQLRKIPRGQVKLFEQIAAWPERLLQILTAYFNILHLEFAPR